MATSSTGITQLEAALDHLYGARYALGLAKTEAYTVLEPRIAAECERWLGVLLAMTYGLAEAISTWRDDDDTDSHERTQSP